LRYSRWRDGCKHRRLPTRLGMRHPGSQKHSMGMLLGCARAMAGKVNVQVKVKVQVQVQVQVKIKVQVQIKVKVKTRMMEML
jgi:hypothetical protein